MEKKTLEAKDLITVGIFTAMYFVLMFMCGFLGYIPIFYALLPLIVPIICGVPYMLYLTKVKCFGMVTITGIICGAVMMLSGHSFVPLICGSIFGLIADFVFMAGKYKSKRVTVIGYIVYSLWLMGMFLPFWIMRDAYEKLMSDSMGMEYTTVVFDLFDKIAWAFPILIIIGAITGAFLGLSVLKKHFKRAGIA